MFSQTPDSRECDIQADRVHTSLRVVEVPTATILLYDKSDPEWIVVGKNNKHEQWILPGGKLDEEDIVSVKMIDNAQRCILREVNEEVRCELLTCEFLGIVQDSEADVRLIPAEKLRSTAVATEVSDLSDSDLVEAHFGVPDYVFCAPVTRDQVQTSEELEQVEFIDVRHRAEELGAAHEQVVALYVNSRLTSPQ